MKNEAAAAAEEGARDKDGRVLDLELSTIAKGEGKKTMRRTSLIKLKNYENGISHANRNEVFKGDFVALNRPKMFKI